MADKLLCVEYDKYSTTLSDISYENLYWRTETTCDTIGMSAFVLVFAFKIFILFRTLRVKNLSMDIFVALIKMCEANFCRMM